MLDEKNFRKQMNAEFEKPCFYDGYTLNVYLQF